MDARHPARSGTWLDAAVCHAVGLLAVAAGLVADDAGASTTAVAVVTAVVALTGLALDRLDRGRPAIDVHELEGRVGYRRQMALKLFPLLTCGTWIVVVASVIEGLEVASGEVGEVIALVTLVVPYSVTERLVARRVAPRADADDLALTTQVEDRLRSASDAPATFGWNRPRQLALTLPFVAVTLASLVGVALASSGGGRAFGMFCTLLFGSVAASAVRLAVTDAAVTVDAQGATLAGIGRIPWDEIQAIALRRQSFVLYLDVLTEGPGAWMSRGARRQAKRRNGVLSFPLLAVDAAPEDLVAALHHRRPDAPVMLPGADGELTVL